MYIGRDSFYPQYDREAAKRVFKANVQRVEIETHSYCNRRCDYCPNSAGDRLTDNKQMPEAMFMKVMADLGEIDFRGVIVMQSYNEPLADRIILDRIRQARATVPNATTKIYTNGDYLTPEYMDDLEKAGLQEMHISIHLKPGDKYTDIYVLDRISEVTARIGRPARFRSIRSGEYMITRVPHRKIAIEMRAVNFFSEHGNTRGGLVDGIQVKKVRTSPCSFVFNHLHITFDGTIMPCCHIRSDRPEHENYRIGNVNDFASIFEAFAGPVHTEWRRRLIGSGPKDSPCDTCTAPFMTSDPQALAKVEAAWRRFVVPSDTPAAPAVGMPRVVNTPVAGATAPAISVPVLNMPAAGAAEMPLAVAVTLPSEVEAVATGIAAAGAPTDGSTAAGLPAAGTPTAATPTAGPPAAGLPA